MHDARAIAEETARASYGRLLAWLSSRSNDVAAAEDALADAFKAALESWPENGIPNSPEAWLFTAARRKLIDRARRTRTQTENMPALALAAEEAEAAMRADRPFPDERLKLLFICAHPAIDAGIRTPLMLQTVLGLDAARIASVFLVSPAAMSGRLVRAKRKIKTARIPFDPPGPEEMPARLHAVLEAIYAAFGAGWDTVGADAADGLTQEAIYLARLVTTLMPDESESWGMMSLMLHAEARKAARRVNGVYIPLKEQDSQLWDHDLIEIAEQALSTAWRMQRAGPYQIEAAIQSAHAASRLKNIDTSSDVLLLYEQLINLAPTVGSQVGYAASLSSSDRNDDALKALAVVNSDLADRYQPYWAVKAHILGELGQAPQALTAYDRAIGLAHDDAARQFLIERKRQLTRQSAH